MAYLKEKILEKKKGNGGETKDKQVSHDLINFMSRIGMT